MLTPREELQCGVFDSAVLRGAKGKSVERTVTMYELELFHKESGTSHVAGHAYPVRRGMLLCAKPGQLRYSDFPVRCNYIRILPGQDPDIDRLLAAAPDCIYIEDEGAIEDLMGLFTKLCSLLIGDHAAEGLGTLRANRVLLDILYRLGGFWQGKGEVIARTPVHRIAADAYEYLSEHYAEDCSLKTVAAALHVSPNHLHTVFSREVGQTPLAYVMQRRVHRAKRLIAAGEKSMQEIAIEVGFCSQSHFSKAFKEQTGQTPAAYRRHLLENY